jgi:hypothetical protein
LTPYLTIATPPTGLYTVSIDERLYDPHDHRERATPTHPFVSYLAAAGQIAPSTSRNG